ncbi:hypothetical protein EKO27_g1734 [Xylaria grammica]|uniref:MYND-type domain-containing protein n=1 Tax=Xylaria grammica TaxID=363999 RepID=A0A439DG84_9PEZI|nr:hypothetical protein EKO27_g1734 [Xylaria grammica]
MDSVEELFRGFTDPESVRVSEGETSYRFTKALAQFLKGPASEDPDYEYLITHARKAFSPGESTVNYFCQQMAHLAVQKSINRKDKSHKARQFKYHRWFALGMKHETFPFPTARPPGPPSTARIATMVNPICCASCGKGNANMRCPGCAFQDDRFIVEKTSYCNKQCLQDHYETHNPICEGRKMIYRATSLLYFIFVAMQEATYIYPLEDIHKKNGVLYAVDGNFDRVGMTGRRMFIPFPKHLLESMQPSDSTDLQRSLVLWGQSDELCLSLFDLVKFLLKPICKTIEQAYVHPRNVLTPICYLSEGKALNICMFRHTVLKVTLRSNEKYVIDLCSAQFGWKETLAPWAPWAELRSAQSSILEYQRTTNKLGAGILNSALEMEQQEARGMLIKAVLEGLDNILHTNSADKHRSFDQLLKSDTDNYKSVEYDVKEMVRQKVFIVITNQYHKEQYRVWMGCDPLFGIYLAKNRAKTLRKLWMTTKEYDRLKSSGEDMRKLWAERFDNKIKEIVAQEIAAKKKKSDKHKN